MLFANYIICGIVAVGLVDLVYGQIGPAPPRLNIPGAIALPYQQQYRNDRQTPIRVRRPVLKKQSPLHIQPTLSPRSFDEKPVTEPPEEEVINTFVPNILQPQQQPYSQTTIFNNDPINSNTIINPSPNTLITDALESLQQELNLGRFPDRHQAQPSPTPPQYIQRPSSTVLPSDFPGFSGVQRFAVERSSRPQIQPHHQQHQQHHQQHQQTPQPQQLVRRPQKQQPQFDNYPEQAPIQVTRAPPQRIHNNVHKEVYHRSEDHNNLNAIQDTKKKPVAQIIRKYRDEHEDGTITWGYENDDGSFKEEIIGMDCITR
ncbi:hypothetical protein ACFFRR_000039 [Megaselia abdita]